MQYTGLKDKNGKEIYEGDILLTNNQTYNYEVKFEDCSFGVQTKHYGFINLIGCGELEIIGNIYENPELLN